METPIEIPRHNHPMTSSSGFALRCHWCNTGGYISNGYHCKKCDIWFHKDCACHDFTKIIHTSHPEHLLKYISFDIAYDQCGICTRLITTDFYRCVTCERSFSLHMSCAKEPPPLTIQHHQAHMHPLVLFPVSRNPKHICKACKEGVDGKLAYRCFKCEVVFHVKCINSPEVNHPCHSKHSLKLLTSGAPNYSDNTCLLCGLKFEGGMFYHCSICNFSVCIICSSIPPPIDVKHLKTHEHNLTLLARKISFTCNSCGLQDDKCSPYICLKCGFMVHRSCIGLPRVININRHDHRISFTQQLGFGDCVCHICLQSVNRFYGAYTCSVCVNYVVHSQCATRNDVWDGIELEGIPEETKDIMSFRKLGDNLINHFSHGKHNLKLNYEGRTTHGRCEACQLFVYSDEPVYSCEQCEFILHEKCANLPPKKQHMFNNKPFTLQVPESFWDFVFSCSACEELCSGFRYVSGNIVLDVRCIFISEWFSTIRHRHPLHYNKKYTGKCDGCHRSISSSHGAFWCESCDYSLDYRCAVLPETVKHVSDQHSLSLMTCQENESGKYWCDICEEEMDPRKWFYRCSDCEVSLHVKCVIGDFSHLSPGRIFVFRFREMVMIENKHSSRPICTVCRLRCKTPYILHVLRSEWFPYDEFLCSEICLFNYNSDNNIDI